MPPAGFQPALNAPEALTHLALTSGNVLAGGPFWMLVPASMRLAMPRAVEPWRTPDRPHRAMRARSQALSKSSPITMTITMRT